MSLLTKMKYSFESKGMDKETFTVISFKGFEAISKPYKFEILLISESANIDPLKVLQNPALFTIHRDQEDDVKFNGILMQFEETQEFDGHLFFKAVLTPKLWWLSLTHHNQVFLDLSVPDIIEHALKDGGLNPGIDFSFNLMNDYQPLEYVCQYDESHFNFVSRWAEREGMYYFFEQTPNGEKVIFTDSKMEHKDLLPGKDLIYLPQSGLDTLHTKEVIQNFLCRHNMLPRKVLLKDYNYLKPSFSMEGIADVDKDGRGENYVYGVNFDSPEEGNRLAQIRAEALICRKSVFHGESSVPFIIPGYTFDLNDHYKDAYNRKYLVSEVTHEGHQTGYLISGLSKVLDKKDESMFYSNTFTAIYSDEQFRTEHLSEKPKIAGTINAKIDAAGSGEHAELDEHGRYKVILPFDKSGKFNGKASAFFRMMQPSAGQNQGMHFPLHKGTEVLLTFIDGNPDRPVIAGAMPNPETSSPVTDGNQTKSIISTGKSSVDGSVGAGDAKARARSDSDNYIEFEDAAGSERIRIHSDGDLWQEAQDRFAEYTIGVPSTSEARPTHISDLIDKMRTHSASGFGPTNVALYKDGVPYEGTGTHSFPSSGTDAAKWAYLVDKGKVTIAKGDTFNTQEGNIYDFGGYWNYNLGNSYAEDHLNQAAELNKTRNLDLLDKGGPRWTEVDWGKGLEPSTSAGSKIESGDIKIGSSKDWKVNGGSTNVWVSKQFGRSYSYSEVNSIEVNTGSSLDIQHGGRHVEVEFRGGGSMKSWSKSESGKHWEKKWTSDGDLIYEADSNASTGIVNEKIWNRYKDDIPMISKKYENKKDGFSEAYTYCRDTGNRIALAKRHQGANSVHTYDFNWANTASASLNFAAGAAFSLNMSEQGSINIDISAAQSLNLSLSSDISLNFKAGICAEWTFPIPGVGILIKNEMDMSTLKIDLDVNGFQAKFFGIDLKAKSPTLIKLEKQGAVKVIHASAIELQDAKLKLRKTGIDLTI